EAAGERSVARHRQEARGDGAEGIVFHRAQAVSERGLLQRHHHARAGNSGGNVHRDVCHRPHAGVDRELQGSDGGTDAHLSSAPDLRRPGAQLVRADEGPKVRRVQPVTSKAHDFQAGCGVQLASFFNGETTQRWETAPTVPSASASTTTTTPISSRTTETIPRI